MMKTKGRNLRWPAARQLQMKKAGCGPPLNFLNTVDLSAIRPHQAAENALNFHPRGMNSHRLKLGI
jgi:hypothetical protein